MERKNTWELHWNNHKNDNIYWTPAVHTGHMTDILSINFTTTLKNVITPYNEEETALLSGPQWP